MLRSFGFNEVWLLLLAARWTIALSLAAFICGGAVGLCVAVLRIAPTRLRYLAVVYIQLVQAIPALMLLLLFYYGLNLFGIRVDAWTAAILAFTLSTSAFLAEIWRGCIQAVPRRPMGCLALPRARLFAQPAAGDLSAGAAHGVAADRRLHGASREGHVAGRADRLHGACAGRARRSTP